MHHEVEHLLVGAAPVVIAFEVFVHARGATVGVGEIASRLAEQTRVLGLLATAAHEAADEKVAFLKLGTLVIETYENKAAALRSGAIDHVAIDVKDIEKVHEMITGAGLNTTQDEVHFLPFWKNGVRFFTIEGPNKEKVEFSQYL